jgi:hypothetical protein
MSTITLADITEKLKYAPSSVLERILGYADGILENNHEFFLSEIQKEHIRRQSEVPLENCIDANDVFNQLKKAHDL